LLIATRTAEQREALHVSFMGVKEISGISKSGALGRGGGWTFYKRGKRGSRRSGRKVKKEVET